MAGLPTVMIFNVDLAFSLSGLALVQSRIPMPDQALANLQDSKLT